MVFSKKHPVIQKTLLEYSVADIKKIYTSIEKKDEDEISKLIGYPSLSEMDDNSKKKYAEEFRKSSRNIKNTLLKISNFYLSNLQFYNDYKHGFRIFPTTSSPPDSDTFGAIFQIIKTGSFNKVKIRRSDYLEKEADLAIKISQRIVNIMSILLPIFRKRIIHDKDSFSLILFNDIEK